MKSSLKVLHVEDSERDVALISRHLKRDYDLSYHRVDTPDAFREALTQEWDIILCDYRMPHFNALRALAILKEVGIDTPVIIISGTIGEEIAVEAIKSGASDYLMKDKLTRLVPAIERQREEVRNKRERRKTEAQLRRSEAGYRRLVDTSYEGIWTINKELKTTYANQRLAQMLAIELDELMESSALDFIPDATYLEAAQGWERRIEGIAEQYDLLLRRKDGADLWVIACTTPIYNEQGAFEGSLSMLTDITNRKRAEQEMERLNAQLNEQQQRLNNIVASVPGVVFESRGPSATTQDVAFISDYVEKMVGYGKEDWFEKPNFWLSIAHPEDKERISRQAAKAFAAGENFTVEYRWITRGGELLWVQANAATILDEDRRPVGMRGVVIDITERKRTEEFNLRRSAHASLRSEIMASFAKTDASMQKVLEGCAEALVRKPVAALARIWTINTKGDALELQVSRTAIAEPDTQPDIIPIGVSMIGEIAARRVAHIENETQPTFDRDLADWAASEGVKSFAGYPLVVEGRLVGVMGLYSRERFEEDTLEAIASVADIISQGIERKRAQEALYASEEQLRQSQRLEAVGQLAGGIAHDFNNLLTVITGYSDLTLMRLSKDETIKERLGQDDVLRKNIEEIKKAGERAASLTRQLLAFSRKQVLQPKVLAINSIVSDMERMLRRLIGEDIDLFTVLAPSVGQIKADPGQIEQVIVNLAVNARDAMPQGGKLTIETTNIELTQDYAHTHHPVKAGSYVMLAVSDNGAGMDAEVQKRIFEPFFTTKPLGKGTGLGLATVYGIVKQSEGNIWVYSEVGKGTTFKIYLPRVDEQARSDVNGPRSHTLSGRETLLLVEDEEAVRGLTKALLEMSGYHVLEAASGDEAIALFDQYGGQIDMVITDVVMPRMSGRELITRLEAVTPKIKVLYLSGYTDDAIVRHGLLDGNLPFLQKPFTAEGLIRKVREVLDPEQVA